jgi:hypothetical protein
VAIIFAIVSDALAAVPTLIKGWRSPETESIWPFLIGTFSPITSFLVATTWKFSELAFPIYLIAINLVLLLSISKKIKFLSRKTKNNLPSFSLTKPPHNKKTQTHTTK